MSKGYGNPAVYEGEKLMYTTAYLDEVRKFDPILAQQLQTGKVPEHRPVWSSNNLTETRDLVADEAQRLEVWIQR